MTTRTQMYAAVRQAADLGRRATLDPGAFVPRGPDNDGNAYGEPLDRWQQRAIDEAIKHLLPKPKASVPDGDRDGVTYDPWVDYERLNRQMQAVWRAVRDGHWWTLRQLSLRTGMPEASVSARLRDLRKPRFGEQEVQRRRATNGLWQYRVVRKSTA